MKKSSFTSMLIVGSIFTLPISFSSCNDSRQEDDLTSCSEETAAVDANTRMINQLRFYNEKLSRNKDLNQEDVATLRSRKIVHAAQMSSVGAALGSSESGGMGVLLAAVSMSSSALASPKFISSGSAKRWWGECAKAISYYLTNGAIPTDESAGGYMFTFTNVPSRYRTAGMSLGQMQNDVFEILSKGLSSQYELNLISGELRTAYQDEALESECIQCIVDSWSNGGVVCVRLSGVVQQVFDYYSEVLRKVNNHEDLEKLINDYALVIEANKTLSERQRLTLYNMLIMGAYSHEYWKKYSV